MHTTRGRILLVRHAQTRANIDQVWHGITDTPLTPEGHRQASLAGHYINDHFAPLSKVYASQLQRARHTAEAIAQHQGLTVESDKRLQEVDNGDWEEMSYADLHEQHNYWSNTMREDSYSAPGGESRREVTRRMLASLSEIARRHIEETVAVVSHGLAIAMVLAHLTESESADWSTYDTQNTGITILNSADLSVIEFNITAHLDDALDRGSK
ncbi:MAG: histidine phosphatase family protein [Gammaproteobacteria bacterium]|nr:histidine phosphatase family protein [Gammaproteobacteria bacterium]